ncbi:MAG: AsmA-like C-terminal region-containing protein, partial [Bacteroidales bacterium]|nr:AsmA-like C-terminal region-containing protein [Bacteroidales bacterium]
MSEENNSRKARRHPYLHAGLMAFFGLWAVIIVVLQIVLNSTVLGNIVNKFASEYIDGSLTYSSINASMFRSFPNLNISVKDFALTYPHDRYAEFDSVGAPNIARDMGRAEAADTLASFKDLSLSVNYVAIIFGKYKIPHANIDRVRVFAHQYDSTKANWDMFKIASSDDEDDNSGFKIPPIVIGGVSMTGSPTAYYSNQADTLFAAMNMNQLAFDGKIATSNPQKNKIRLNLDSLFVSGRIPADTASLNLEHLRVYEHHNHMDFDATADAHLATSAFGRMDIPIELYGEVGFPKSEGIAIDLEELTASIAGIELEGSADIEIIDSIYVDGQLNVTDCKVNNVINTFKNNFPILKSFSTNALLSMGIQAKGWYNSIHGTLPEIAAYAKVPNASFTYIDLKKNGTIDLDLTAATGKEGLIDASLNSFELKFAGVDLGIKGAGFDLLGDDPLFELKGNGRADLSEVVTVLPEDMGISASGDVSLSLDGSILMSQMTPYNFSQSDLIAKLESSMISVKDSPDDISAYILRPTVMMNKGLTASIDSVKANVSDISAGLTSAKFSAKNSLELMAGSDILHPFVGKLGIQSVNVTLSDSTTLGIRSTDNTFTVKRKPGKKVYTPILSLDNKNASISGHAGVNRINLKDAGFHISAAMHTFEKGQRRRQYVDSLHKANPGVRKDSLLIRERSGKRTRDLPEWLREDDFRKKDIDIRLDENLVKYINEWDITGSLDIKEGLVITPYFPLKNQIYDAKGTFTNDRIDLKNFTFAPGESDISAAGSLSGLKRAFTDKGTITLDLDITSNSINANELLAAYDLGSKYEAPKGADMSDLNDEEYLNQVTFDNLGDNTDTNFELFVIPSNLVANVSLQCSQIKYSDLNIDWLAADLVMKQRTLQLTNTLATSNMGDIYFEGFYSTKTKQNIAAGFDLNMVDISADQVISLMPAVDTIMPMLKAFKGMLDCEMAVTTQLDTNMNIIMPSVNGIVKINGQKLSLEETGPIKTLARVLMFRNKKTGFIDDMKMNGIIKDNVLEIFPFILKIDRYKLALSGLQNLDDDFQYHVSVLKSPIPFRFGINLFGNFDKWKWRLSKAK